MQWSSLTSEASTSAVGSEGGTIVLDEEHEDGARITLEKGASVAPFAITCGIYGWMVHTRYFGVEGDARVAFEDMKRDLDEIMKGLPLNSDPEKDRKMSAAMRALGDFVDRYP